MSLKEECKKCYGRGYSDGPEAIHCQQCSGTGGVMPRPAAIAKTPSALDKQVDGGHYKDLAIQPMEYCQRNGLGFAESSAIKYITRHKSKNKAVDIKKAIHCLELLLHLEYNE